MSVYTPVSQAELHQFLSQYALGDLITLSEISDGIENSNYSLTTTDGDYILTLFEASDIDEIGFALNLMRHLRKAGLPCARPIANHMQGFIGQLSGKPATVVSKLDGKSILSPGIRHCQQIGDHLATLHIANSKRTAQRENPRGKLWREKTYNKLVPHLSSNDKALLEDEINFQAQQMIGTLPHGIIHADLFRDNVLFQGDRLTGLIDFYHSGVDSLLYDLAITVNDWCFTTAARPKFDHLHALLQAYEAKRPLQATEKAAWPVLLRRAALRFFMSRLLHHYRPRTGIETQKKDPYIFRDILHYHRENILTWPA